MSSFPPLLFHDKLSILPTLYLPLFLSSISSFPPSSCLMGLTISQDSRLIDRWELAMCKHFTHPFASHHPWHHRSQTHSTPTGPLHIAVSAVSSFFSVGRREEGRQGERVWAVVGPVRSLIEGHLSKCRGGNRQSQQRWREAYVLKINE